MKKLLQIALISSSLCASGVHAHIGDLMYIRGDISGYKFNNISIADKNTTFGQYNDRVGIKGGKYTHKYNYGGTIGLGYIVNKQFRTEIVYNKIYTDKFKFTDRPTYTSSKIKANINAFFARGIYDILDLGITQCFIGGGVGIANVRHTVKGTTNATITTTPAVVAPPAPAVTAVQNVPYGIKSKNKNNFAFSLMVGTTTKIIDNLRIEVAYSFTNYGKTSRLNAFGGGGQVSLNAHSVSVGLRYDLM